MLLINFSSIAFFSDFLLKRVKIIELKIEVNLINNEKSDLLKKLIAWLKTINLAKI